MGVVADGKYMFKWVQERTKTSPFYVWGHSLGTGWANMHCIKEDVLFLFMNTVCCIAWVTNLPVIKSYRIWKWNVIHILFVTGKWSSNGLLRGWCPVGGSKFSHPSRVTTSVPVQPEAELWYLTGAHCRCWVKFGIWTFQIPLQKMGEVCLGGLGTQWSDDAGTLLATFPCLFLQIIAQKVQISSCAGED
jgi:hypothetical protein